MVPRIRAAATATVPSLPSFITHTGIRLLCGLIVLLLATPVLGAGKASRAGRVQSSSTKSKEDSGTAKAAASAVALAGPRNTIVFFEVGFRSDLGTFTTRESVGRIETEEVIDVKSIGPMFYMGFLTKIYGPFRVGGALGYGMNSKLVERPTSEQKEDENFEAQEFRFGQLVTLDLRLEFSKHLGHKFWLVLVPRGGLSIIQVGEDLREATEALSESHNILQPRMGLILGGDLGLRYQHNPWFGVRAVVGLSYAGQSYLKATRNGDAADSDHSWSSSLSRISSGIAGEVSF